MFTLRETEDHRFIYRCRACGWECELIATDQVAAADEALECTKTHKCCAEQLPPLATRNPKAR
jgi:hypothetical protein